MSDTLAPPGAPTAGGIERRSLERPVEFRAAAEGTDSPGVLVGYALTFNSLSRDLGGWFEIIDPGALGAIALDGAVDLVAHGRVMARTNHDSNLLLGTSDVGTLLLFVDDIGLRYEVDLPNTSYARDLAVLAKRGDIRFSSFAFRLLPDGYEWEYDPEDRLVRRVLRLALVDVAPVADPAYWGSSSEMRSVDLDAVRASLKPQAGPPGEWERSFLDRVKDFSTTNPKENAS